MKRSSSNQKQSNNNRGKARGRMFMRQYMGWLPGYPLPGDPVGFSAETVTWQIMPRQHLTAAESVELTRDHLRQATYCYNKLRSQFPRALPQIVDDLDRWLYVVPRLLDVLKRPIHFGEALPPSLLTDAWYPPAVVSDARRLLVKVPQLRPIVHALSWQCVLVVSDFKQALAWLAESHDALVALFAKLPAERALPLGCTLYELSRRHGAADVAPLLAWLGDRRVWELVISDVPTTKQLPKHVLAWQTRVEAGQNWRMPHAGLLGNTLAELTEQLLMKRDKAGRAVLRTYALLLPDDFLDSWQAWWQRAADLMRDRATPTDLKQHRQTYPRKFDLASLNGLVKWFEQPNGVQSADELLQLLCALPIWLDGRLLRLGIVRHWYQLCVMSYRMPSNDRTERIGSIFRQLRRAIDAGMPLPGLVDGGPICALNADRRHARYEEFTDFVDELFSDYRPSQIPVLFAALKQYVSRFDASLDTEQISVLVDLLELVPNFDIAFAYLRSLIAHSLDQEYIELEILRLAVRVHAGHAPELFGAVVRPFFESLDIYQKWHSFSMIETMLDQLDAAGWHGMLWHWINNGWWPDVLRLLKFYQVGAAGQIDIAPPETPIPAAYPARLDRFPYSLQPLLAVLDMLETQSGQRINWQRVVAKEFPDPGKVTREVSALERMVSAESPPHLHKRLANLRQRLNAPPQNLSEARLATLQLKLETLIQRSVLSIWLNRAQVGIRRYVETVLEQTSVPDWLLEPQQLVILASLLRQAGPTRQLGLRLLSERCGSRPWDLRDDPVNQRYRVQMTKRGLNWEPWLSADSARHMQGEDGTHVWLALEDDPLEIFHMGGHFKTCLSPGQFNFFSVFANAADINKRVIYARTEQGQILGRCLIVITDTGHLMTFQPYCHRSELEFDKLINRFVSELAGAMGTTVVTSGAVKTLVAADWYDDGPRDICQMFDFLQFGSKFRKSLDTLPPNQLVDKLTALFAPLPLNGLTLPLVLELPELKQRPELVLPLLPLVESCKGLSQQALLRAATLGHQAGEIAFGKHIVRDRTIPHLREQLKTYWTSNFDLDAFELLIELYPSMALRLLRQTRPQTVHGDLQEPPRRREWIAAAYERLNRPKAAELRESLAV